MYSTTADTLRSNQAVSKTILVVEDDEVTGSLISEIITQETPHRVLLARDGFQALELVREFETRPQLFILDYRMPGMNGINLYDQLHAISELDQIPAIILSASIEEQKDQIQARNIIGLGKPFDTDEFLLTIEEELVDVSNYQGL
jgi:CheY-like chemotaxis protein